MDHGNADQVVDDGFETRMAIVGEMRASDVSSSAFDKDLVQWYKGQLLNFDDNKQLCTKDDVVAQLGDHYNDAVVFLRVGESTFRLCAFQSSTRISASGLSASDASSPLTSSLSSAPPGHAVTPAAEADGTSAFAASSIGAGAGSPSRKANDRYTSAVAFEFVTNVISNVIGEDLYSTNADGDE